MKTPLLHLTAFIMIVLASSCLYDTPKDLAQINVLCDTTDCYKNIRPIVFAKCAISGCHVSGGAGVGDYTVFANFKSEAASGNLGLRINLDPGDVNYMPKDGTLSEADLNTLNNWINNGAQGCW